MSLVLSLEPGHTWHHGGSRMDVDAEKTTLLNARRQLWFTNPSALERLWADRGLESKNGSVQETKHPIDVPEAIVEHDLVGGLAELGDIALRFAP